MLLVEDEVLFCKFAAGSCTTEFGAQFFSEVSSLQTNFCCFEVCAGVCEFNEVFLVLHRPCWAQGDGQVARAWGSFRLKILRGTFGKPRSHRPPGHSDCYSPLSQISVPVALPSQ